MCGSLCVPAPLPLCTPARPYLPPSRKSSGCSVCEFESSWVTVGSVWTTTASTAVSSDVAAGDTSPSSLPWLLLLLILIPCAVSFTVVRCIKWKPVPTIELDRLDDASPVDTPLSLRSPRPAPLRHRNAPRWSGSERCSPVHCPPGSHAGCAIPWPGRRIRRSRGTGMESRTQCPPTVSMCPAVPRLCHCPDHSHFSHHT